MAIDTREFDQFTAQAQMKLTGASTNGIKAELYDVLKEFFEDSSCWREDISFIPLTTKDVYRLAPAQEGQIIRLIGVWDTNGSPVSAFMPDFSDVQLAHAPSFDGDADHKWTARVVKTVTLPITGKGVPIAPDWAIRVHSIHILDGLLGKMMAQQQKSYSNNTMSAYHLKRFRTGIQIVKVAAERANLVGAQNWAFPRGWGSNSQRGGTSTAWPTRV